MFFFLFFAELVGKGGEGATAREVLKWKSVEKVVMVDIDEVSSSATRISGLKLLVYEAVSY